MRRRKGLRAQMLDWNHAAREIKRAALAARNGEPSQVTVHGRTFATLRFPDVASVNDFLERVDGWGVIAEDAQGRPHIARKDDKGLQQCSGS